MATEVLIEMGDCVFQAEINNSPTAKIFLKRLPLEVTLSRWGEELYGDCGLEITQDDSAREVMEIGELAIWPPGNAFCIFFGPTPASTDKKPRAASPANPIGRIMNDTSKLKKLGPGTKAAVRKSE